MGSLVDFLREYRNNPISDYLPARITDKYDICSCLSQKESRQVFLIRRKSDSKKYVLKCLNSVTGENPEEEFRLLTGLTHTSIVPATDFLKDEDKSYIIREYVEGNTVTELVEMSREGFLKDEQIIDITKQLCQVLGYLHSQKPPIIHRDIKPDNIIITKEGKLKLIDFGISRRYASNQEKDTVIIGSQFSAPPEQYGFRQTDARSDIYSLGVLMLYMATGSLDLKDSDKSAISKPIRKCIEKCTRFAPKDRYVSVWSLETSLRKEILISKYYKGFKAAGVVLLVVIAYISGAITTLHFGRTNAQDKLAADSTMMENIPDTQEYHFASTLIEAAVRSELNKSESDIITVGDLKKVKELYICGQQVYHDWEEHFVYGASQYMHGSEYTKAGIYHLNGYITSLEDLALMPYINTLALYNQEISDLSPLKDLKYLARLGLGANKIEDISPLGGLANIKTLDLSGNDISDDDLQTILKLPHLVSLDIGATNITSIHELKEIPLTYLSLFETTLSNCDGLKDMTSLDQLIITGVGQTITEKELTEIASMENLKILNIMGGQPIDPAIFSGMPNLRTLDLCGKGSIDLDHLENPGIEQLLLDCIEDLNLTGIERNQSLKLVSLRDSGCYDYTPLLELANLEEVSCNSQEAEAIKNQLGDIPFIISIVEIN